MSCFSEEENNILMWSHYTDNHKGAVIEFDPNQIYWGNAGFKQVIYQDVRVKLDEMVDSALTFANKLMTTKFSCWSYEKEWRLIYNVKNEIGEQHQLYYPFTIDPNSIKSIALGLRTTDEEYYRVKDIIEKNKILSHIIIKKVCIDNDLYKLNIDNVDQL